MNGVAALAPADNRVLRLDEALAGLDNLATIAGTETVPLAAALDRVLGSDIVAGLAVPPHDNAAVDGYAVRAGDLPGPLRIIGRAAAGHPFTGKIGPGDAVRIFTGAPMPAGADAVLMQEDCRVEGATLLPPARIRSGANWRQSGEDVRPGAVVLRAGRRLAPQDVGLLAALGVRDVPVRIRLRAAVFSTGDELAEPGTSRAPGQIYDSNRAMLLALGVRVGLAVADLGILPDDRPTIRRALDEAASEHDLLLTSGGVSVGEEDHVRAVIASSGALAFWRLAIKPGRPVALGEIAGTPVVGLPGNPVAAMVTFLLLVRPLIARLAGETRPEPQRVPAEAGFATAKKRGRREFLRGSLGPGPGVLPCASRFAQDGSGILTSLVTTGGLIDLPEESGDIAPGDPVAFVSYADLMT